eukprot:TRINITY_DN11462_c0_g1_i3.p2 TRINITY_DN11462_c0_g1~~TRINITY_DN11462_c0_g1_i3.p2  ORF type:complete len:325 (+),score=32.72 TRINITY_DN11462_c0_g1_i3:1581-2555(+)
MALGSLPQPQIKDLHHQEWHISSSKHHMLPSRCHKRPQCVDNSSQPACQFCTFSAQFSFPLPEEVYPNNILTLTHASGAEIRISALGALSGIDSSKAQVQVSYAAEWQEARKAWTSSIAVPEEYDWTYTSTYAGQTNDQFKIAESENRIDYTHLQRPEKILFQDELYLYADDFGDNGQVTVNVRIRVMPSSFLVLLRQFIRVDRVFVRVRDTRFYHRFGTDHVIREQVWLEAPTATIEGSVEGIDRRARAALYDPSQVSLDGLYMRLCLGCAFVSRVCSSASGASGPGQWTLMLDCILKTSHPHTWNVLLTPFAHTVEFSCSKA